MKRFVVALVAVVALIAPRSAHASGPKVLVYGDSIMKESSSHIVAAMPGWDVTVVGRAGQSPCDYLKSASKAFAKVVSHVVIHYDLFVVESAGNSNTTCMRAPGSTHKLVIGSAEWLAKYRSDLNALVDLAASQGTAVEFVSPPPFAGAASPRNAVVTSVESQLAADRPAVVFTDGPRLKVSDAGAFEPQMPCMSDETSAMGCAAGEIIVRAPDQIHFCPDGFHNKIAVTGCDVYASGAARFGRAIAAAIEAS